MMGSEKLLQRLTLALAGLIVASLALAALGGMLELPWLVFFWYLALLGILAMIGLTALLALSRAMDALVRRYRNLLVFWGDAAHGH